MTRKVFVLCALLLVPQWVKAERIVVGVVEQADSYWKGNLIHTDYVLRVGDERVAVTLPGGTIGDETHGTSLAMPLETGGRYLVFLGDENAPPAAVGSFIVRDPAVPPIVVNPLPASSPFSPHDQHQMAYWNVYAPGLFQVTDSPSATWSFGNGVSDIAGFPDSAKMEAEFGEPWSARVYSFTSYRVQGGHIVETDIALNPAFPWTLDEDRATRLGGPQSFQHAILSGLGIAWGLSPSFSLAPRDRESVVGLTGQPYKFARLFSDDTAAVRSAFGGAPIRDGLISAYSIEPFPVHPYQIPVRVVPAAVLPGRRVRVVNPVKIENTGTEALVNPQVEIYLVPRRFSMDGAVLLKRVRLRGTVPSRGLQDVAVGRIGIPATVPPGTYWLAFQLRAAGDQYRPNDFAWSDADVTLTVKAR